jgi:hypothetical protein
MDSGLKQNPDNIIGQGFAESGRTQKGYIVRQSAEFYALAYPPSGKGRAKDINDRGHIDKQKQHDAGKKK